jgi:hypothetical protein
MVRDRIYVLTALQVAILTEPVQRLSPPEPIDSAPETMARRIRRDSGAFFTGIFGPA